MELSAIQSKIYEIRGYRVMLDRDLAEMYQVETRVLNQAVKRNPHAFTELGVAMLSSVLNTRASRQINIGIMPAFVAVSQLLANPPAYRIFELQDEVEELKGYIEDVFADHNDMNEHTRLQLDLINETLAELQMKNRQINKTRNQVGYFRPEERASCIRIDSSLE